VPFEGLIKIDIPTFETARSNHQLLTLEPSTCICPQFLIADDDAFNILTLESILSSLSYTCETAYHGRQVIDKLMDRIKNPCGIDCYPFRIIFLDCNMPVMDGYACLANLKEIFNKHPEFKCPVIACTAAAQDSEKQKAFESGFTDFCTKPISKSRISDLVKLYCKDTY